MINARDLFVEISNQPVLENGESVGYFVKNSRMDALEELLSANSPQPAAVVPEECPDELLAFCEQVIDSRITANAKADELWSACRAAMLHDFRRAACTHGFPPGAHTQGVIGCVECSGRLVMIWEQSNGGDCES
ncbi:hypothetical protein CBH90_15375 [Salmonella enterica]|nr:hypothetical protein [Salmonella enterica]